MFEIGAALILIKNKLYMSTFFGPPGHVIDLIQVWIEGVITDPSTIVLDLTAHIFLKNKE